MKRTYTLISHSINLHPHALLEWIKTEYYTRHPTKKDQKNPFGFCIVYYVINKDKKMKLDFIYPEDVRLTMKFVHKRPKGAKPGEGIRIIDWREILNIMIPPYRKKYYFDFIFYVLDITTDEYWVTNLWTGTYCSDLRYYLSRERKREYYDIGLKLAKEYTRTTILGHVNLKTGMLKSSSGISRLIRNGWIPTISLLPQPYGEMVRLIESTNDMIKINSHAIEAFNAHLIDDIYDRWKHASLVKKRETVLRIALEAYKNNDFHTPVYILLPQIEGLITDHIKRKRQSPQPNLADRFVQFGDIIKRETFNTELTRYLTDILITNLRQAFFKTWYPYRRGGKRYQLSNLSPQRNVVMHGELNEKYFIPENCIKLICILDAIILLSLPKKEMPALL